MFQCFTCENSPKSQSLRTSEELIRRFSGLMSGTERFLSAWLYLNKAPCWLFLSLVSSYSGCGDERTAEVLTSVNDFVGVAPVDGFDQLENVAADFIWRSAVRKLLQQLQHVLQETPGGSSEESRRGGEEERRRTGEEVSR